MQDFTKLKVWQKAHNFTVNLYKLTASFPIEERYGLTNQIRRASVSIESNISEGCGRNGDFGRLTFAGNPQITPSE
ncbi:MAG: four helix bundle protein [Waterburya sp.]